MPAVHCAQEGQKAIRQGLVHPSHAHKHLTHATAGGGCLKRERRGSECRVIRQPGGPLFGLPKMLNGFLKAKETFGSPSCDKLRASKLAHRVRRKVLAAQGL